MTADSVVRTSIALVVARTEVKRIRALMAACKCIYEFGPKDEHGMYASPIRRSHCYATVKTRGVWEQPCWKVAPAEDGDGYGPPAIGDVADEGWCDACAARQKLRDQLIPAVRHAGAVERGHLAATKAHMRRIGLLAPTPKRAKAKPPKPPSLAPWQEDPNDVPF